MPIDAQSGRAVAIARRQAMSAGKAALPPPDERVRDGFRSASTALSTNVVAVPAPSAAPTLVAPPPVVPRQASPGLSGRAASLERRRALSAGKTAIGEAPQPGKLDLPAGIPGRDVSRARRAALSQTGRTDTPPPSQAASPRGLIYPPKVVESVTGGGQRVTGSRMGRGDRVTGDERGTIQPVSGTQYVEAGAGGSWRAGGPKVGLSKTEGGQTVSGTLVRSAVAITGDEAGNANVTGRVDQSPADDITTRTGSGGRVPAQFQGRLGPLGAGGMGGRAGSRQRECERAAELTGGGAVITGSSLGRGGRVTGDEGSANRNVTGNHYLATRRRPADRDATEPSGAVAGAIQPARTPKAVAQSWGGQRVSGLDVEHNQRVTGDAPGSCSALTGSQYHGPSTAQVCAGDQAETATQRRMRTRTSQPVTGNTPVHADGVTGTGKGAGRDITGTNYYCAETAPAAVSPDPVAELDSRFSIRSPQRAAQLAASRGTPGEKPITGSFAAGGGKLTGNLEFQSRRRAAEAGRAGASTQISGEGNVAGTAITGNAWGNKGRVTGVDGSFAAERNPSERGGGAGKPFAGAAIFKTKATQLESNLTVTGLHGSFSKAGARVTLSGGAQT